MKQIIVSAIASVVFVVGLAPVVSAQVAKDAIYARVHAVQIQFINAKVTAVSSGVAVGNTAVVGPGASITVEADYLFTFSANPADYTFCPGCVIQNYVAWISPAATEGATPTNLGLWNGQSVSPTNISTREGATSGHFVFNTTAPTTPGEYRIGVGQSLDFNFLPSVQGTGGFDPVIGLTGSQIFSSYLISVVSVPPVDCPGDADGSGTVDFADITSVLGNWLAICP